MHDRQSSPVSEHNQPAADMWSSGGKGYDEVSFAISDALLHACQRLAPRSGETILDLATGTGWTARNVARSGASVDAVDIASDLLAAAKLCSAHISPPIRFTHADAENLPFDAATFDRVISTFGVMFAGDHKAAADELTRVIKPGGRMVLATWVPDGTVAEFFDLIARHSNAPAPDQPPLNWGKKDHLVDLFGEDFDLVFETGTNNARHEDEGEIWTWYLNGFGPLKSLYQSLDDDAATRLKADIDAYHAGHQVPAGLLIQRDYLITIATRR